MGATTTIDDSLHDFLGVRDRLLRIARGIAGSDAEDVVQDAWLRWNTIDRTVVRDVPAFLSRTTTRLSISRIQSAYRRYQSTVGLWPAETGPGAPDPAAAVVEAEQVRAAMAVLVSRLGPRERVAYLLREAFGLPHRQIAGLLGLTEAYARQLIHRAKAKVTAEPGERVATQEQLDLLTAFTEVSRTGDPAALVRLAVPSAGRSGRRQAI